MPGNRIVSVCLNAPVRAQLVLIISKKHQKPERERKGKEPNNLSLFFFSTLLVIAFVVSPSSFIF